MFSMHNSFCNIYYFSVWNMADSSQPGSILKNTGYINASTSSTNNNNNGEEKLYEYTGKGWMIIYYSIYVLYVLTFCIHVLVAQYNTYVGRYYNTTLLHLVVLLLVIDYWVTIFRAKSCINRYWNYLLILIYTLPPLIEYDRSVKHLPGKTVHNIHLMEIKYLYLSIDLYMIWVLVFYINYLKMIYISTGKCWLQKKMLPEFL